MDAAAPAPTVEAVYERVSIDLTDLYASACTRLAADPRLPSFPSATQAAILSGATSEEAQFIVRSLFTLKELVLRDQLNKLSNRLLCLPIGAGADAEALFHAAERADAQAAQAQAEGASLAAREAELVLESSLDAFLADDGAITAALEGAFED